MIIGIGTDIVEIRRVGKAFERSGAALVRRVLTAREQAQAAALPESRRMAFYAKRFAGKEAVAKALGVGIGGQAHFHDIEITRDDSGAPVATLAGAALRTALKKSDGKPVRVFLSLSDDVFAQAYAVIESL